MARAGWLALAIASPGGRARALTRARRRAATLRAAAEGSHLHHRQHAGRADAVRRLARDAAARAVPEARPGHPQSRLQRRRGRDAAAVEELRHARRVAERARPRRSAATRRTASTAPTRRRTSSSRSSATTSPTPARPGSRVQEAARRLDHAHAGAEVQRQVGAAHRAVLADRARGPAQSRTCPTAGRTTSAWRCTRRRWREVATARGVTFVDLFAPTPSSSTPTAKAPLTIQGVHLNAEGNRQHRAGHRPRRCSATPPKLPRPAYLATPAAGGRRQELPLVQPLSHDRRLRHVRRPRVPDVHPRQPAQRQPRPDGEGGQGRRAADQLRGAAARDLRSST